MEICNWYAILDKGLFSEPKIQGGQVYFVEVLFGPVKLDWLRLKAVAWLIMILIY